MDAHIHAIMRLIAIASKSALSGKCVIALIQSTKRE